MPYDLSHVWNRNKNKNKKTNKKQAQTQGVVEEKDEFFSVCLNKLKKRNPPNPLQDIRLSCKFLLTSKAKENILVPNGIT